MLQQPVLCTSILHKIGSFSFCLHVVGSSESGSMTCESRVCMLDLRITGAMHFPDCQQGRPIRAQAANRCSFRPHSLPHWKNRAPQNVPTADTDAAHSTARRLPPVAGTDHKSPAPLMVAQRGSPECAPLPSAAIRTSWTSRSPGSPAGSRRAPPWSPPTPTPPRSRRGSAGRPGARS